MPASDQVWYNPKVMHIVFGVSSVVMLIATVWMMADDHLREWKEWQLASRHIEEWTLSARISGEDTAEYALALEQGEADLAAARSEMIDEAIVELFEDELEAGDSDDLRSAYEPLKDLAAAAGEARETANAARDTLASQLAAVQAAATTGDSIRERREMDDAVDVFEAANVNLRKAEQAAAEVRDQVLSEMAAIVGEARLLEDNLSRETKFTKGQLTAVVSTRDIAVGQGASEEVVAGHQAIVDSLKNIAEDLTARLDAAKDHRLALEAIVKTIMAEEADAQKKLEESQADLARLHATLGERSTSLKVAFGEWLIRQPVLDAFYNGDMGIEQIWLPELTIDYNFQDVGRFDRCVTCHRAIDQTAPGSPVTPAYHPESRTKVKLTTPSEPPGPIMGPSGREQPVTLASVYGISLADRGRVNWNDVAIEYVWPEKAGALAGLQMGDVIESIGDARIRTKEQVENFLLGEDIAWGQPLVLSIRRGVPHPFSSHPRPDLFVGSLSPHKQGEVGCTICHDGQGSATAFKWASHTPNDVDQALEWSDRHSWFDNHHWIYPMRPDRFVESNCLKCHHEVTDLEPSERFPDPPAPKLVEGYNLIRRFGCYGCHEINGFDGPNRRIGPDLRAEPNYFAAAHSLSDDPALSDQERGWARHLVEHPEDDAIRRRLFEAIDSDQQLAGNPQTADQKRLKASTHKLGGLLKDMQTPGSLPKPGPSLRFLKSKVDFAFLYSWIRQPSDFRPSTRMPQFFGQWEHLSGSGLADSERFEPIEIRAIAHYLLEASKPFDYLPGAARAIEEASAERGKERFETGQCLACHSHEDFPGIQQDQGPDLSRIGAKLNTPNGPEWLYSWLKKPHRYHARTKMPDNFLDPIEELDDQGKPTGEVTDPAADIAAYLLGSSDWEAQNVPSGTPTDLTDDERAALEELALEWLTASFPKRRATAYLKDGIPASMEGRLKSAERALIGPLTDQDRVKKQLDYIGLQTIGKYGCAGCHDIPGFEDAMPIGTALADWGRKDASKLAFELIGSFLAHRGIDGDGNTGHAAGEEAGGGHGHGLSPEDFDSDTGYFLQALNSHRREGFIWQKLRLPRSYDYEKTENKGYNERLRMPKFPMTAEQREAIITFVLGLVAEPPPAQYVYDPDPRTKAIIEGRQVLDKYNCAGCHTLRTERWEFDYHPDDFGPPSTGVPDFPFLEAHFTPEEIADSLAKDSRGLLHAVVHGMPELNVENGQPQVVDIDGGELEPIDVEEGEEPYYSFSIWRHALIGGETRKVGGRPILYVPQAGLKRYPAWGGMLARYLYPKVIATERRVTPTLTASDAWGWLPPPLVGEGTKVQPDWLYDFLLDPSRIRPAAVMRMPNFHMSPAEARKLANYFAAVDGADYPYQFDRRRRSSYELAMNEEQPGRLAGGLGIVLDRTFCVTCHLVGDFRPDGRVAALAPNLDLVYRRLRPEFVRRWVANPIRILPYTGMPVNIPYEGGIDQKIFPGSSTEQLDAVVDFLMNYDVFAERQMSIQSQIKPAAPVEAQPTE